MPQPTHLLARSGKGRGAPWARSASQASQGGGGGGGADALLGYLTITEGAASAKTNEPFQIAWPFAPAEIGTGQTVRIYDDNGSGGKGTVLTNFQIDGLSTDMVGDERMSVISGIVPSLGSGATRKLWVESSSTAVPTGTAITEADLFATSWRLLLTFDIGGTSYTIDTDNLEGASTTWSKTAAVRHDDYMSGPGTVCFVYSAPPMNAGSAHASGNGLRVWFHIYARKAGTAAVSGGNPITVVDCDIELCNFDTERASPAHYWYGLQVQRSTSLSDGTLITTDRTDIDGNVTRYVYARSSPAVTLTATGATSTGAKTWTRASGTWDTDILGAHIKPSSGSGGAYVTARNSATSIDVYVYDAFAATSFTSGNWTVEGCGHHYGSSWTINTVVGTAPTSCALWGDNTSAVTPTTVAGIAHLASKKAVSNYAFPFSNVTHDMTNLNLMRADTAIRPFVQRGPEGTFKGDCETNVGGASDRDDIGFTAQWCVNALAKADANGRRKMFENSLYYGSAAYLNVRRYSGSPTAGSLGVVPRPDNGNHYSFDSRWGTFMPFPSVYWDPFDGDNGHQPEPHYAPFLYTGRLIYMQRLQQACLYYCMSTCDPAYQGTGINCTVFGDGTYTIRGGNGWGGSLQQRSVAWTLRDQAITRFITPDASKPSIYNDKSVYTTWLTNTWNRADFVKDTYTNGTGSEDWFDTDGPRWAGTRFNGDLDFAPWQTRYLDLTMNNMVEMGLTTADTQAILEWFAVGYVGASQSADVAPDWMSTAYYVAHSTVDGSLTKIANVQSWADTYQAWALFKGPYETTSGGGNYRRPATITLSATSGASVTVTMTGSPFGQTSWYAGNGGSIGGGWIYQTDGNPGCGRIVSVSNANTCVIDTTVAGGAAFSSTTPTASGVAIPIPHPSDAAADGTLTGRDTVYMMLYRLGGVLYKDRGVDTAACVSYITGSTGFPATIHNKFNINSRT